MSDSIDWSKAPEGTTHWDPVDCNHLKQAGKYSQWWSIKRGWESSPWQYPDDLSSMTRLIARPIWNGEGLPPVGTICELRKKNGGWGQATIKYMSQTTCVWLWDNGNPYQREWAGEPWDMEFRPIRTPEQIAAEERNRAVDAMLKIAEGPHDGSNRKIHVSRPMIEALYDDGYRKFEIVDE